MNLTQIIERCAVGSHIHYISDGEFGIRGFHYAGHITAINTAEGAPLQITPDPEGKPTHAGGTVEVCIQVMVPTSHGSFGAGDKKLDWVEFADPDLGPRSGTWHFADGTSFSILPSRKEETKLLKEQEELNPGPPQVQVDSAKTPEELGLPGTVPADKSEKAKDKK